MQDSDKLIIIDPDWTPSTSSGTTAAASSNHAPTIDDDDVYAVSRLSRQPTANDSTDTSFWLVSAQNRRTSGDPNGTDVGDFLRQSNLFGEEFHSFLSINNSIPKPQSRMHNTDGWTELVEQRTDWKLDPEVSRALKSLIRASRSRQSAAEDPSNRTAVIRSWLIAATQTGMQARLETIGDSASLIQSPRYRPSPILIDYLAGLRTGTYDTRTREAARVISDWLDVTVVDGDAERRHEERDRRCDEKKTLAVWHSWWY